jgi:hypothetical protein
MKSMDPYMVRLEPVVEAMVLFHHSNKCHGSDLDIEDDGVAGIGVATVDVSFISFTYVLML